MSDLDFGRLEAVGLRSGWSDEAAAFTPWLAEPENLELLGQELGLDLQLVEREMNVGRYWADMVCRNGEDGGYVLIENQLGRSDHKHLGQILTYVAGLNGSGHSIEAAVWICKDITDDHRAALDWLNETAGDACQFFAAKIELWRIGDSAAAPRFHVIARPNEWSQGVKEVLESASREPTDLKLRTLPTPDCGRRSRSLERARDFRLASPALGSLPSPPTMTSRAKSSESSSSGPCSTSIGATGTRPLRGSEQT